MKIILIGLFLSLGLNANTVFVPGKIQKNGTFRKQHFKTSPNKTKLDNYSSKGNSNPFTNKKGTK